jgi:MipA family protein
VVGRVRKSLVIAVAVLAGVAWGAPALAQGPPGAGGGVQWSLGVGVISSPRPYVGAQNTTTVIPLLELSYERFFVQGIRLGYRFTDPGPFSLAVIAGPRFLGYDESDSPFLGGMADRKGAIDVGLAAAWNRRRWGVGGHLRRDVSGNSDGAQAGVDVFIRRTALGGKLRLQPALGLEWLDGSTVDYYYGVRESEALPERPAYRGTSTTNVSLSLLSTYRLDSRLNLIVLLNGSLLGDGAADSPIVDRKASYFGLAGITYRF